MATVFSGTSGLTNGTTSLGSDFVDLLGNGRIKPQNNSVATSGLHRAHGTNGMRTLAGGKQCLR